MLKKSIILMIVAVFQLSIAFTQTISRKVTASSGGILTGGGNILTFSMGETLTATLSAGGNMITQGFEQPGEEVHTGTIVDPLCAGSNVTVPYNAIDIGGGNTFTAQLSDASGNFASPVDIGTNSGNASGNISAIIPGNIAAGAAYRIRVISSSPAVTGTDNGLSITINICGTLANLKLFLQGYYIDGGIMQPVLLNQGINAQANETDSIVVELHDAATFALLESKQAVLLTDGNVSASFTQAPGLYYVAIKHRNTIQTWSTDPVTITAVSPLYDFTTAPNKAFGNNQVEVQTGKWAFYTGDLNQDDFVDGNDFPAFDTDSFNGVNTVYVATDMNGDGFVDGNDFPVFDVNSFNGVSAVYPL